MNLIKHTHNRSNPGHLLFVKSEFPADILIKFQYILKVFERAVYYITNSIQTISNGTCEDNFQLETHR